MSPTYFVQNVHKMRKTKKYDILSKIDGVHSWEEKWIGSLLEELWASHYKGLGVAGAAYNDTRCKNPSEEFGRQIFRSKREH